MRTVSVDERLPYAVTWTVEEPIQRSSHALADGGRVWLIDPVAHDAALAVVEQLGEISAVIPLLDRHDRDCSALADRYRIPLLRLPEQLAETPFEVTALVSMPGWREVCLWWERRSLAVVAEAVGTGRLFALGRTSLGVHPVLRLRPPKSLRRLAPERLLVGHGPPLHEGATAALREALARSRRDAPSAAVELARAFMPGR